MWSHSPAHCCSAARLIELQSLAQGICSFSTSFPQPRLMLGKPIDEAPPEGCWAQLFNSCVLQRESHRHRG